MNPPDDPPIASQPPTVHPTPLPESWSFGRAPGATHDYLVVQIASPNGVAVHFLPFPFAADVIAKMSSLIEKRTILPATQTDIAKLDDHRHRE